jgi:membrane protease YdiL (CAAX protease family)
MKNDAFTLVHLVVYNFTSLLIISPFSFLIAYKVQKHKDISIGLLAHFFMNTPFIIRLFIA